MNRGEPRLRVSEQMTAEQLEELWHNLFRMHGYAREDCQQNADTLLLASWARIKMLLPDDRLAYLEKPSEA